MAKPKSTGKAASKSPKKISRVRTSAKKVTAGAGRDTLERSKARPGKPGAQFSKAADSETDDALDITRQQLHKLTEKLHEAAEKGIHAIKEAASDIQLYARDATELTKIRIDVHHLREERKNLLVLMGEKLRNMHRANKLSRIPAKFAADFKKLDELEDRLEEMERVGEDHSSKMKTV